MSNNIPPLGTTKQTWIQKCPAEEQTWSGATSPETHAVNFSHDNNNNHNQKACGASTHLMMLRPAQAGRAQRSRAEAETSPFLSCFGAAGRRRREQRPGGEPRLAAQRLGRARLLVRQDVCCSKHAPANGQTRTFMVSLEMRRRKKKEGGERAFRHD